MALKGSFVWKEVGRSEYEERMKTARIDNTFMNFGCKGEKSSRSNWKLNEVKEEIF